MGAIITIPSSVGSAPNTMALYIAPKSWPTSAIRSASTSGCAASRSTACRSISASASTAGTSCAIEVGVAFHGKRPSTSSDTAPCRARSCASSRNSVRFEVGAPYSTQWKKTMPGPGSPDAGLTR